MVGASRKRFLGTLTGREAGRDRVAGSVAAAVVALLGGATFLRVHDVAPTVDALAVAGAVEGAMNDPLEIELRGLAVHAHHGVHRPTSRSAASASWSTWCSSRRARRACESDRLEDAVDYGAVADVVVRTATERRYDLIERLAAVIGDTLLARLPARAGPDLGAQAGGSDRPPVRRRHRVGRTCPGPDVVVAVPPNRGDLARRGCQAPPKRGMLAP